MRAHRCYLDTSDCGPYGCRLRLSMPESVMLTGSVQIGLGRLAVGPAALAYVAAALAVASGPGRFTTYAGHSLPLAVITAGSGIAVLAAGYVTMLVMPANRLGPLAVAAGVLWFAPVWLGWEGGPPLVRSLAMLAMPMATAVVLQVVLAYPGGQIATNGDRVLVRALYAGFTFVAISRLFYDPFMDPACWADCTDNAFLIGEVGRLSAAIRTFVLVLSAAGSILAAIMVFLRLAASSRLARRSGWPILPAAVVLAGTSVGYAIVAHRMPAENPGATAYAAIATATSAGWLLLAAALLWAAVREVRKRRSMLGLIATLDADPVGSPAVRLSQAMSDPDLSIRYWLHELGRFVDHRGREVPAPRPQPRRTLTSLFRDGRLVGVIAHSDPDIARLISPAIRLGLENELLRLKVQVQLDALRSSRARIIERADLHRRELERNLHDGAQAQMVSLLHSLGRSTARARHVGDEQEVVALEQAAAVAHGALADLRQLAHGLYPASLEQGGLAGAVRYLALDAQLPVETGRTVDRRLPAPVEIAAHRLMAEVVDGAKARGATYVAIDITLDDQMLVISLDDDSDAPIRAAVHLSDRVGAIGGQIRSGTGSLRAMIPCE